MYFCNHFLHLILFMFQFTITRCFSRTQFSLIKIDKLVSPMLCHLPQKIPTHKSIRPSIDDVERISKGLAAKRRGTGSRAVPHRLNAEERIEWEIAKKKKYLVLSGSGWRKERGDSPLANIYRQYCDAVDIPCISVRRGNQRYFITASILCKVFSFYSLYFYFFNHRHGS